MTERELIETLRRLADYIDGIKEPLTIREEDDRMLYRQCADTIERLTRERDIYQARLADAVTKKRTA